MDNAAQKALRNFDWPAFQAALPRGGNVEARRVITRVVDDLTRSSTLCVFQDDVKRVKARDGFVKSFVEYLRSHRMKRLVQELNESVRRERLIESGYHAIARSVTRHLRTRLSAVRHAWVVLCNAQREIHAVNAKVREIIERSAGGSLDIGSAWLPSEGGNLMDASEHVDRLVALVASTLLMLGRQNNWFASETRQIILPSHEVPEPVDFGSAVVDVVLSNSWHLLRRGSDRIRQFGGSVTRGKQRLEFSDRTIDADCLRLSWDTLPHELVYVAQLRLRQMLLQWSAQVHLEMDLRAKLADSDVAALPPRQFISEAEIRASIAISQLLWKPVVEHKTEYAGLTIVEWIRGYSFLQKYARSKSANNFPADNSSDTEIRRYIESLIVPLDQADFLDRLRRAGLAERKAVLFLDAITFAGHSDMLDAPIVRCADDQRFLLPIIGEMIEPAMVVMSQLSRIRADLGWKGKTFENHLIQLLRRHGLSAHPLHHRKGTDDVEIDCVLVWGDHLFVFECKNTALPDEGEGAASHFFHDQCDGIGQARAKLAWLRKRPEIIRKLVGRRTKIARWVPVVVNGLPFSWGKRINGVYSTDASAMGKFFDDPRIAQSIVSELRPNIRLKVRQVLMEMHQGNPKPGDFVKMLEMAPQFSLVYDRCTVANCPTILAEGYYLVTPIITRQPSDLTSMAQALGLDPKKVLAHRRRIETQIDSIRAKAEREGITDVRTPRSE